MRDRKHCGTTERDNLARHALAHSYPLTMDPAPRRRVHQGGRFVPSNRCLNYSNQSRPEAASRLRALH
jgi:hypothetical protein